jgi:PAS domain S-box-containing protein
MTAPFGTEPLGGLSPEELLLALDAAHAGTFRVDLRTRRLWLSPSLARLYGVAPGGGPHHVDDFVALVHPEDRDRLAEAVRGAIEDGIPYSIDIRAVWPDGSVHWLQGAGRRVDDGAGNPAALVGVARATDRERATEASNDAIRTLVDAVYAKAPVGLAFVDADLRYVRINTALARINGVSVEEHLGRRVRDVLPAPLGDLVEARVREARDTGRVVTSDDIASAVGPDGDDGTAGRRHFNVSYYPVTAEDGTVAGVGIVLSDMTSRAEAAEANERALERTQFLADVSAALDASLDYDATLSAVADLTVRRIADWCAIDMIDDDGGLRNVAVAHIEPEKVAMAKELQERYPPDLDAPTGAPKVARTGESELYPEITPEVIELTGADAEQVELIRELGLSSAMIVPLRARGRVLGALTLIATHGRAGYGPDDLAFAEQIAARAAMAVDNARLYREAREQQRRSAEARALLDTLIDQAPIGFAFLDAEHRFIRVNDTLADLNGIPADDHVGRRLDDLFPDLADVVAGAIDEVVATGRPVADLEVMRRLPDGSTVHHLVSHYPVRLSGGELLGVGVAVTDLTARVAAREELRAQRDLYEALMRAQSELGEAFALLDGEQIVFVNRAAERLTGRTAEELYALDSVFALVPPEHRRVVGGRLREARLGVEPREPAFVTEILRADGTRVPIEAAGRPLPAEGDDRLVLIARDITERHHQEAERERLLRTEQAARRASEAAHARVRLLADASALLERSMSDEESLQDVAELLVAQLSDSAMIDVQNRDGRIRRLGAASRAPRGDALLRRLAESRRVQMASDHPIQRTLRAQQATFLDDPAEHYMRDIAPTDDELARFRDAAGRSLAVVPLVARGRSVGALTVGWQKPGRRPLRDEWSLIEALAQRIALAVDSALQYQERAYVARTLQKSLLPGALPSVPGVDLAAEYVPGGEGMEVGGDFFDVFAIGGQDEWAIVIGDVCGKGAEAAAVTALARYTLRAVSTRSPSPAATLATLNDEMLRQMPDPRFLTAVLGHLVVDPAGGARVTLASGGHLPPVVLRANGPPEVAESRGMLLGVEPHARVVDGLLTLDAGDALVLYTDGITEARAERPIPPQALADALQPMLDAGAAAIARRAVAMAEEHAHGALRDDVAVLVVQMIERGDESAAGDGSERA